MFSYQVDEDGMLAENWSKTQVGGIKSDGR